VKWLALVAFLVACEKGDPKGPAGGGAMDRSCKVDGDCAMSGPLDCCDTACGRNFGSPVNVKALAAASKARDKRCKGEECHVMCPKLPDCREEARAVCKAGTCEEAREPNEACKKAGATVENYCETKDDCRLMSMGEDCCDRCGGTPMNREAAGKARAALEKKCGGPNRNCPAIDCPVPTVDCVSNTCVLAQ
jgi:hypothetical protein